MTTPDHQLITRRRAKPPQRVSFSPYLAWIRRHPCLVCRAGSQREPTEAHHFGPRAYGTKAPDRDALPLCRWHHRLGPDSVHTLGRSFAQHHRLDPRAEIARLNREYDERRAA